MATTRNQSDTMNDLFKTYGLVYDAENKKDSDVFITKNFKIITRTGVEKIQAALKIDIKLEVLYLDPFYAGLKVIGTLGDTVIETTGEASIDRKEVILEHESVEKETEITDKDGEKRYAPFKKTVSEAVEVVTIKGNVQQNPVYLLAMAEKRGKARAILQLAGLYALGVYSEDEADEFREEIKKERKY